jgi:hypothetical protein
MSGDPGGLFGFPDDTDRDGEVDVLYLAGQRPAAQENGCRSPPSTGRPGRASSPGSCPQTGGTPMAATSWFTWPPTAGTSSPRRSASECGRPWASC